MIETCAYETEQKQCTPRFVVTVPKSRRNERFEKLVKILLDNMGEGK